MPMQVSKQPCCNFALQVDEKTQPRSAPTALPAEVMRLSTSATSSPLLEMTSTRLASLSRRSRWPPRALVKHDLSALALLQRLPLVRPPPPAEAE